MVEVPDEKALTGLGRTELVTLIRALEKERNEWQALHFELTELYAKDVNELNTLALKAQKERDEYKARGGW